MFKAVGRVYLLRIATKTKSEKGRGGVRLCFMSHRAVARAPAPISPYPHFLLFFLSQTPVSWYPLRESSSICLLRELLYCRSASIMGGDGGIGVALRSTRVLTYLILAYGLFHLAMHFGKWYGENLEEGDNGLDKLAFVLSGEGEDEILIRTSRAQLFFFLACPIILAAALGGVYEALWLTREAKAPATSDATGSPGICGTVHSIMHTQFRPFGSSFFP